MSLFFTIKGVKFLQCAIRRKTINGDFDLVRIKNCSTNTYKWVKYSKLKEILKNIYYE